MSVRLTINDADVSYSLENEKTLGEIVHGIRTWLAAAGFVITDLRADGRDLLEPDASWGAARVDTVAALRVTAAHTGDMKVAHWRTVDRWLGMLDEEVGRPPGAAIPKPDILDPLEQLLEGLSQTMEGLAANPFLPPGSDAGKRFAARFTGQKAATVRSWNSEEKREAVDLIRQLRSAVQVRIEDATHPRESLSRCAALIGSCMSELKEVSLLLQTGRDRPAMEIVIRFADSVQSLMDILPFLDPDAERARLLAELTPVLRELVAAFDSRDSVLIGDLLEYEVAPRMERIAPLLEKAEIRGVPRREIRGVPRREIRGVPRRETPGAR
jgi:hypothetical protein